jgi:NAD(P)-dependent dehydrogenase (short-subunit alcohol dehydrogenase family)
MAGQQKSERLVRTDRAVFSSTKIAIVTGGSRGLGRNTVLNLAQRGVDSIFSYHSNQAEAEKVVSLVAQAGRKAVALQLDTGKVGDFDLFVQSVGPRRIAVNTVAPGAIATDFSGGIVRDKPEVSKLVADMTALGRAGVPDDIGPMIASLLSEDNRWINAQRIEVSGGMSI